MTFIKKHLFTLAIFACTACAYLFPDPFLGFENYRFTNLVGPLLMIIMFGMGTTLSPKDFIRIAKMPIPVMIGALLQFAVMPASGFLLAKAFNLEPELAAGTIMIGSVAGGAASNVMAYIARANVALSVTMTCVSTFLAPFLTPVMMRLWAGKFVEIAAVDMALAIVKLTIVPVLAGLITHLLLKKQFEKRRETMDAILSLVSKTGICIILAVMIAPERDKLREAGLLLLAVAAIHNAVGLNAGYWMTRAAGVIGAKIAARLGKGDGRKTIISEADCRTIAIEVGMQNGAMGTALANKFISSTAALVPNIFGVWMDISGSILAKWWSNHPPEEERG